MRRSPGRIARPFCLLVALGLCAGAGFALYTGITRHGEQAAMGMQAAFTLAVLALVWVLIGIMFTLARPGFVEREPASGSSNSRHAGTQVESERKNWFQASTPAKPVTAARR